MYSDDAQQYPAYALNVENIHLRSGTTIPAPKLPLIIEIPNTPIALEPLVSKEVDPTNVTSLAQAQLAVDPPFLEKLIQSRLAKIEEKSFDIID